jgi:hypothetical protein
VSWFRFSRTVRFDLAVVRPVANLNYYSKGDMAEDALTTHDIRREFPVCPGCGSKRYVSVPTAPSREAALDFLECRDCRKDILAAYLALKNNSRSAGQL